LPAGIKVISSSLESDAQLGGGFVRSQYYPADLIALFNSNWNEVLLVMSGEELASSMKLPGARIADLRVLLLVSPEEFLRESAATLTEDRPPSNADDEGGSANELTVSWRKAFMRDVPTWSADEVAEHGGYGAKNKSAAANRWTKDGKIFSVLYGGKQYYPQFQFRHGEPRPAVARILRALGDEATGWDRAFFFATPNSYLDDARPMDRLNDKSTEELLVQLARRHANPADIF